MGLRGCGKTTLGPQLAQRRDYAFVDLDQRTAARLGAPSAAVALREMGESAFRKAEAAALADVLDEYDLTIIALGGGTPTAPGAAASIRQAIHEGMALCVYLRATPATLRTRMSEPTAPDRPALTPRGTYDEVDELFRARDPLYESLATNIIDVDGLGVPQTLAAVLRLIPPLP